MNTTALGFFVCIVAVTLVVTWWASRRNSSTSTHYVAGGGIGGVQNGLAIAGDYVSAASFLGISGAIALGGFNGFYLAVGVPIAYLLVLLTVAEPLRNLGRFTMADMVAARFPEPRIRGAVAINTLVVSIVYMVVQFVGAGALVQLLLGIPFEVAVVVIGVLMIVYTLLGGMLATTWIQIIKTGVLLAGALALTFLVLHNNNHGHAPWDVFAKATETFGESAVAPHRSGLVASLDTISLEVGLALGVMGLPHVMIRFLTVPNAKAARTSAVVALWIFGGFYLLLPILGYGAATTLGREAIAKANPAGNLAAVQLSEKLGGDILLAFISAVAFSTILAVLSGIVIASSGAFAHDLYTHVLRRNNVSEVGQLKAARISAVFIALVSLALALGSRTFNLAFLANLAFAIAASANLPTILLSLYWRRFNRTGAMLSMVGGLVTAVSLVLLSPNVMGESAPFPLTIPALVSVPVGFGLAVVGTLIADRRSVRTVEADETYDRIHRRLLLGADG